MRQALALVAVLGLGACDTCRRAPSAPSAPEAGGSAATDRARLERIGVDNLGRLERVRGYRHEIANVHLLGDGTILVDRLDELDLVDRSGKLRARLPVDARVDPTSSAVTEAWAVSADATEIAVVRLLSRWSGVVVYGTDGTERARYPIQKIGRAPRILSFSRDRIAWSGDGHVLSILDRKTGGAGPEVSFDGQLRFDRDGTVAVVDRGGEIERVPLAAGGSGALVGYRKDVQRALTLRAGTLSLAGDGRAVVVGDEPEVDLINLVSKKRTAELSASLIGDPWGRAGKLAVVGKRGVGLVDLTSPTSTEWKLIPPFPCAGKTAPCNDRDVQWKDLRFPSASSKWPTLVGTTARSLIVWTPGERARVFEPGDHEPTVEAFAPDGRHLIEHDDRGARVLAVPEAGADASADSWPVVVASESGRRRGRFSADGKLVALFGEGGFRVWELATRRVIATHAPPSLHLPGGMSLTAVDFDDRLVREMLLGLDGELGGREGDLTLRLRVTRDDASAVVTNTAAELVDVRSGAVRWRGNVPGATRGWAIEPGGKRLAAALGLTKNVFLVFDVGASSAEPTLVPTAGSVYSVAFIGGRIVSTTSRGELTSSKGGARWTVSAADASPPCSVLRDGPALHVGARGARVIVGSAKRCIFDAETGAFIAQVGDVGLQFVGISSDTTELYTFANGVLDRWDATTGNALATLKVALPDTLGHSRRPIAWSTDGARIAVAAKDAVVIFDRKTGTETSRVAWPGAMSIALSEGPEQLLAVADRDGHGAILDATGKERARFFCPERGGHFDVPAWSHDGRSLSCLKIDGYGEPLAVGHVFVVPAR